MSALPAGDYAIVEILGHRTIVGRVEEVERFGTKLMSIEPAFNGGLLDAVLIGGGSIYQFTPCSAEIAAQQAPTDEWQLPPSVRAVLPSAMLPAPEFEPPSFLSEPLGPSEFADVFNADFDRAPKDGSLVMGQLADGKEQPMVWWANWPGWREISVGEVMGEPVAPVAWRPLTHAEACEIEIPF